MKSYVPVVDFVIHYITKCDFALSAGCLIAFYLGLTCWEFGKILYNSAAVSYQERLQYFAELLTLTETHIRPRTIKLVDGNQSREVDAALATINRASNDFPVLGLDAEMQKRPGECPKIQLMQFATREGDCVLIRTVSMPAVPKALALTLCNQDLWKVGISVYNDVNYLLYDYPGQFQIRGTFDLRYLAYYFGLQERGLKKLAARLLNMGPYSHDGPSWEAEELTPEQIMYAALDAYVSILIFEKFYVMYTQKIHGCTASLDQRTQTDTLRQFLKSWEHKKSKQFRDDYSSMLYSCTSWFRAIFGLQ